eukprot:4669063-Amphidinium_carterae.2
MIWLNLVISFLNWLLLGEPSSFRRPLLTWRQASRTELRHFARMLELTAAFRSCSTVTPPDLARSEESARATFQHLLLLEQIASELHRDLDPYLAFHERRAQSNSEQPRGRDRESTVVSKLPRDSAERIYPVIASRLKFFKTPSFDPRAFLPADLSELFVDPMSFLAIEFSSPPRVQMRRSKVEFIKFCRLLLDSQRLAEDSMRKIQTLCDVWPYMQFQKTQTMTGLSWTHAPQIRGNSVCNGT